jgi:microcystin-dependent protein
MTTNYHTPIANGAPANSSVVESPLAELDEAIGNIAIVERDGHIIQDEGIDLAQQQRLNFHGNQVVVQNTPGVTDIHVREAWPVGSVFTSVVSTNPATLLGYGTWVSFGAGKVLVGLDAAQSEFDAVRETGGAKTHTLTTGEIPVHTHTQDSHNHSQSAHNHTQNPHIHTMSIKAVSTSGGVGYAAYGTGTGVAYEAEQNTAVNQSTTAANVAATATNQNAGSGQEHNNLQPYIVVYFWERTA